MRKAVDYFTACGPFVSIGSKAFDKVNHYALLGRVALGAQRFIVVKLSRERSVSRSVGLSDALWKNGGSDPAAVWHRRSDGSRDEAGGGVWGSVHGKGYFWGRIWGAPL